MKSADLMHRAVSADGTEITGHVHGAGPGLVFLPAGPGDCETTWRPVLPFLRERFTCYLLDTRGRGESEDHPDHSPRRQIEDITAFVESVGAPVGLVEWGSFVGASWALPASQATAAITEVATYDPLTLEVADEEDAARLDGVFEGVAELVAADRVEDVPRGFVEAMAAHGYYTDEDMAGGATLDFWTASVSNIPMFLKELEQAAEAGGPGPGDPEVLAGTTVPVLLLHGARSHPMNIRFVRHVADHVADPHVRPIAGAGHYGPHTAPEAVADELVRFFTGARERAPSR